MVDLSTAIGRLTLKNPVMPASGTFSEALSAVFDIGILGAHVAKTITAELRSGNPTPRVSEAGYSMLNSIGIPSKGIEHFKSAILPLYQQYDVPFVASISAPTVDEFAFICEQVSVPGVDAIEINISCPNIEDDGKAFAGRPDTTRQVIEKLRPLTDIPLWAKLTPNTGMIVEVAKVAEEAGADALVVANTILAMQIDIDTRKPTLGNIMGGLSGPAIKPIALRMAYQCARSVDIPVIGCGGVASAEDVVEFLLAGAAAVQVGTATFIKPSCMQTILADLVTYCGANGIDTISDLIGAVDDKNAADGAMLMGVGL